MKQIFTNPCRLANLASACMQVRVRTHILFFSISNTLAQIVGGCHSVAVVLEYPPRPASGSIKVLEMDVQSLDAMQCLNDVIIDFYIR